MSTHQLKMFEVCIVPRRMVQEHLPYLEDFLGLLFHVNVLLIGFI